MASLFSIVLSLYIHKISSKHDRDSTASKLNLSLMLLTFTRITFANSKISANVMQFLLSGSLFGHFSIRS